MAVPSASLPARSRAARRSRPPGYASQMAFVATGLIPILVLFGIFAVLPVGIVLWLSLHKYNQLAPVAPFIGMRNFEYAFTNDALFINALTVTLKYALVKIGVSCVGVAFRRNSRTLRSASASLGPYALPERYPIGGELLIGSPRGE